VENKSKDTAGNISIFVISGSAGAFFLLAGVWCSAEVQAGSVGAVTDYLRKER